MNIPLDHSLAPALYREKLLFFFWKAFETLHPGDEFLPSPHVEAMCRALTEVASGKTRRLLITIPPRHGKSLVTSVCLPAWMLGHDPALKLIVASYGGDLATKHARDFRTIVTSEWYKRLFPSMRIQVGGNRLDEQITTAQGGREAVSMGGAVTGFGADIIVVDDLLKASDVAHENGLERAWTFISNLCCPDKTTSEAVGSS